MFVGVFIGQTTLYIGDSISYHAYLYIRVGNWHNNYCLYCLWNGSISLILLLFATRQKIDLIVDLQDKHWELIISISLRILLAIALALYAFIYSQESRSVHCRRLDFICCNGFSMKVMKLNVHNLPLWHKEGKNLYAKEQDQNVLSLIEPMAGMFSLLTFSGFLSFRHLLLFHTQPSNIKVVITHLQYLLH